MSAVAREKNAAAHVERRSKRRRKQPRKVRFPYTEKARQADIEPNLVVCGHTHMQFDRAIGGVCVVNAGSVGMPFSKVAG
jgi:predicted phosphodiesterase